MNTYILFIGKDYYKNYFVAKGNNERMVLYEYYKDCGNNDSILYKMCINENIFTTTDIINYCNKHLAYDEEIQEIYLLGEKVYG